MINYERETQRLNKIGVEFNRYDNGIPDYLAIVVKKEELTEDNVKHISEAGYAYAGDYPKMKKCSWYTVPLDELQRIQAE